MCHQRKTKDTRATNLRKFRASFYDYVLTSFRFYAARQRIRDLFENLRKFLARETLA